MAPFLAALGLIFAQNLSITWERLILQARRHHYSVSRRHHYSVSRRILPQAGYTLIISRVSTYSCTICELLCEIANQSLYISHNIADFVHLWFCEKLDENFPYLPFDISWKYWPSGENSEMRDEKNDWRDGLRNAIYTLIISLISPTFFRILVNLTISV